MSNVTPSTNISTELRATLVSRVPESAKYVTPNFKGSLGLNLLYAPGEPFLDFIFVHGLGGGSRKTWSKRSSTKDFWPQEWLPKDPAFTNVRIHSFGYASDWVKGKGNCYNIHHFGKSLIEAMNASTYLREGNTKIVLIGHSLGGLVIKKAYNVASENQKYYSLAERVSAIYFLATPHSSSDSTALLENVLRIAGISQDFVVDVKKGPSTIQTISDDFRKYSSRVDLWSFYETLEVSFGKFSQVIVTPDLAVVGCRGEKKIPINADHRSICKFDSKADPNYLIIRNSLETTVKSLMKTAVSPKDQLQPHNGESDDNEELGQISHLKRQRDQNATIAAYLGVTDDLDREIAIVRDARMPETCQWFSEKATYRNWRDFDNFAPGVLWVCGNPGVGKSFLAGYTVDHLQERNANCSHFFFRYGSASRLSACLRSLAFQMARCNSSIRQKLLQMQREYVKFDKDNEHAVWRALFVSGILQTKFSPHYWIMDALDECANPGALFDMIGTTMKSSTSLRILVTSRRTISLERSFKNLGSHYFQLETISSTDTLEDIRILVKAKTKGLVETDSDRAILEEKIIRKSNGSFLWAMLVLTELFGTTRVLYDQVLDEVPEGMAPLYQRTLDIMSQNKTGYKLAMAILKWATYSTRPLSLIELCGALELSFDGVCLNGLEETIVALCGHLVIVDKFDRVQMVHETARQFLIDDRLDSEFSINPSQAHTSIAMACLTWLTAEEMKPPRINRRHSTPTATRESKLTRPRVAFSLYACVTFSQHLVYADSESEDLLCLVEKFLKCNVLSWIEVIARRQDLLPLIRVATNLRIYLDACSLTRSPMREDMIIIRNWTTDLIRITAKFADALVMSPSSIFSLLTPFCPTGTSIYATDNNGRRLTILGASNTHWEDRLSYIDFHEGSARAIGTGVNYIAIGLSNGIIHLYHSASYQEYKTISHGEDVKFLSFKPDSNLMASCGAHTIRLWNVRIGEIVHTFQAPQRIMCLFFQKNFLIAAGNRNYLATWDLDDNGSRKEDRFWSDSFDTFTTPLIQAPRIIAISVNHQILAVAYGRRPVVLWDLESDTFFGICGQKLSSGETSSHIVTALVFNPHVDINLLAISYTDGQLSVLDPLNNLEKASRRANCYPLASSHDGRLLVGGAGSGIVQIYKFDTLQLLYSVASSAIAINQLAFIPESLRFVDIRGAQCNIWEPPILLHDIAEAEDATESSSSTVEVVSSDSRVKVSSMVLLQKEMVAFCGKEDGSVSVYNLRTGAQMEALYSHKSLVCIMVWCPLSTIIISVDASNCIIGSKIKKEIQGWTVDRQLFQKRLNNGKAIVDLLPSDKAGKFIVSTRSSDHFWRIEGCKEEYQKESDIPGIRKWIQHPQSPLHAVCIDGMSVRIFTWTDWAEVARFSLHLDMESLQLKSIIPLTMDPRQRILLELCEISGSSNTRKIVLVDMTSLNIKRESEGHKEDQFVDAREFFDEPTSQPEAKKISKPGEPSQFDLVAGCISHIIGISKTGALVFLDIHSWVCSMRLEATSSSPLSYLRHFFVPYDWFSGIRIRYIICAMINDDVVFARNDGIAVIKDGMDYIEVVNIQDKS